MQYARIVAERNAPEIGDIRERAQIREIDDGQTDRETGKKIELKECDEKWTQFKRRSHI